MQSYRFAEGAPSSLSLWGSFGAGNVYQFAVRASSLVLLLVAVWLSPTANRANKVMLTEVAANASGACDCQMIQGSVGTQYCETHTSAQAWEFNSAYDNVAGAFPIGLIANGPGAKAPMLRSRSAVLFRTWVRFV